MSKFKIEKGVSRINRIKLQASIEEPVAAELALMCEWSNNDRNYLVNELLRFALSQDSEFQPYKESAASSGEGKAQATAGSVRPEARRQPTLNQASQNPLRVLVSRGNDMVDGLIRSLKLASKTLVRHQIMLSAGLSAAAGIIFRALGPGPCRDVFH